MTPVSFIMTKQNAAFMQRYIQTARISKTQAMNIALDLFRKAKLRAELREGFAKETEADVAEVMSDFADYLSLIEHSEHEKSVQAI